MRSALVEVGEQQREPPQRQPAPALEGRDRQQQQQPQERERRRPGDAPVPATPRRRAAAARRGAAAARRRSPTRRESRRRARRASARLRVFCAPRPVSRKAVKPVERGVEARQHSERPLLQQRLREPRVRVGQPGRERDRGPEHLLGLLALARPRASPRRAPRTRGPRCRGSVHVALDARAADVAQRRRHGVRLARRVRRDVLATRAPRRTERGRGRRRAAASGGGRGVGAASSTSASASGVITASPRASARRTPSAARRAAPRGARPPPRYGGPRSCPSASPGSRRSSARRTSACLGCRPFRQPLSRDQPTGLGGEPEQEARELGRPFVPDPDACAARIGFARLGLRRWPACGSGPSSRGRPSAVKCLRSLTVKDFSLWLISGRGRGVSAVPAPVRSRGILAQVPLRSADAPFLALPARCAPRPAGRPSRRRACRPGRSAARGRPPRASAPRPRGSDGRTGCAPRTTRSRAAAESPPRTTSLLLVRLPWCGTFTTTTTAAPQRALGLARRVAGQQQVHVAEADVEHHGVLVPHPQRRSAAGLRAEHR